MRLYLIKSGDIVKIDKDAQIVKHYYDNYSIGLVRVHSESY